MDYDRLRYISYLMRLWQVQSQGQVVWRATLESPLTGKVIAFPDLQSLFAYLENQIVAAETTERLHDQAGSHDDIQTI